MSVNLIFGRAMSETEYTSNHDWVYPMLHDEKNYVIVSNGSSLHDGLRDRLLKMSGYDVIHHAVPCDDVSGLIHGLSDKKFAVMVSVDASIDYADFKHFLDALFANSCIQNAKVIVDLIPPKLKIEAMEEYRNTNADLYFTAFEKEMIGNASAAELLTKSDSMAINVWDDEDAEFVKHIRDGYGSFGTAIDGDINRRKLGYQIRFFKDGITVEPLILLPEEMTEIYRNKKKRLSRLYAQYALGVVIGIAIIIGTGVSFRHFTTQDICLRCGCGCLTLMVDVILWDRQWKKIDLQQRFAESCITENNKAYCDYLEKHDDTHGE